MKIRYPSGVEVCGTPVDCSPAGLAACAQAIQVHELAETLFGTEFAHSMHDARRYRIGFDVGERQLPSGVVGNDLSSFPWTGLRLIDHTGGSVSLNLTDVAATSLVGGGDFSGALNLDVVFPDGWPAGACLSFALVSAGSFTIDAADGVTINDADGSSWVLDTLYAVCSLVRLDVDAWLLFGGGVHEA